MGQLIYAAITSFDGYVEDQKGNFDWGTPDDEVFAFITEMERPIGTYLYGRRMYETMRYWETAHLVSGQTAHLVPVQPDSSRDFAEVWRAADKIVYSKTAEPVHSAKTRVERDFDVDAVRHLKLSSEHDMTVGGANLAAQAIKAGLVDELQQYLVPVVLGGGKHWLPAGFQMGLELIGTRRFASGVVYLRYRPAP